MSDIGDQNQSVQAAQEQLAARVQALDAAALAPLVRSALGRLAAEPGEWSCRQIQGGLGALGMYRFAGTARDRDEQLPWSLILKVLGGPTSLSGDPAAFEREALAYQSGALGSLRAGLSAPRCYAVDEQPDGSWWLWLEELVDTVGRTWPLEHYGLVARHLGQFSAAYVGDADALAWPWLSRGWLRGKTARHGVVMGQLAQAFDTPLGRLAFPPDHIRRTERLWAARETLLQALERLPQTVCHLDAFRRNLFARGTQTVAVDWAFTGVGAVGEDASVLTIVTLLLQEVDMAQARALDELVFAGYLAGLADAGYHADPRQVRFAYAAHSALRSGLTDTSTFLANYEPAMVEPILGRSIPGEEYAEFYRQLVGFNLDLADEAYALLEVV